MRTRPWVQTPAHERKEGEKRDRERDVVAAEKELSHFVF
jgi:hypothetical protein